MYICFYTCRMYPYHSISRFSSLPFFPWPIQGCLDKSSNLERPSWSSVLYLGDIGGPTMILDQAPWFFVVFGCFRPGSFVECFWFIWPSILRSTLCSWVEHKKLIRQSAECMRVYFGNRFKHPNRLVFLVWICSLARQGACRTTISSSKSSVGDQKGWTKQTANIFQQLPSGLCPRWLEPCTTYTIKGLDFHLDLQSLVGLPWSLLASRCVAEVVQIEVLLELKLTFSSVSNSYIIISRNCPPKKIVCFVGPGPL